MCIAHGVHSCTVAQLHSCTVAMHMVHMVHSKRYKESHISSPSWPLFSGFTHNEPCADCNVSTTLQCLNSRVFVIPFHGLHRPIYPIREEWPHRHHGQHIIMERWWGFEQHVIMARWWQQKRQLRKCQRGIQGDCMISTNMMFIVVELWLRIVLQNQCIWCKM